MKKYDVIVIGAGPGGYESAYELSKNGIKTLLIDKSEKHIGGVCLNEGCIPTKNYLQSAEFFLKAPFFKERGIKLEIANLDLKELKNKTEALINELRSGLLWTLKQAGVEFTYGNATFIDKNTIEVNGEKISFSKSIIATGRESLKTPLIKTDGKKVISSKELFLLETLPKSVVIIGGGAIGCEMASFFSAFGVNVTIVAKREQLLPSEDEDIAKALAREFKKMGIKILTCVSVEKMDIKKESIELSINGEKDEVLTCDLVLLAIGRAPNTKDLNLQNAGVEITSKGFIKVNEFFQTTQEHIFSVGDCIDTPAFAHTAYAEARIVAQNIINRPAYTNTHINPSVVFTHPQVASCGLKEKTAKEQNIEIEVKKAYFKINAKAKINGDDSGFIKIIICKETGVVLGASIIGENASEIIHELILTIEKKITAKEIAKMIHVHPSISEIIRFL